VIEEALIGEDQGLSLLLAGLAKHDRVSPRGSELTWTYFGMSVVVLVFGLVVGAPGALALGIVMLMLIPVVIK
jgi:hypothetical protein